MAVSEQQLESFASSHDIISLGMAADEVRRARHDARTTFVRVADIRADLGSPAIWPPAAGEVRIVGMPETRAAAVARVAEVSARMGTAPLTGFSLADLEQIAAREAVTLRALLEELQAAGLELVAEAPFDRLVDARRSVEEVNIAGLGLARLTIDQYASADSLPVLRAVSDLQRTVGVIKAFAPLPHRINPAVPTTGYEDVKRVALARLVCDNIPSIQVDWARYGPKLAQVALTVGADDVDGVSAEDETTEGRRRAPLEEIRRNIRAAGLEPVERSGRFDPIPS
jgi:aminodeoxyfutalosine synthase